MQDWRQNIIAAGLAMLREASWTARAPTETSA
jgi:hypothetical protein